MKFIQLRNDLIIHLESIDVVHYIRPEKNKHVVRMYIRGTKHDYRLTNEQWTKLQMLLKGHA
jgi:hypothetical protein